MLVDPGTHMMPMEQPHALAAARLIGLVADGELRVVIDRFIPLAEAAVAHAYLDDRKAFGRVVLIP